MGFVLGAIFALIGVYSIVTGTASINEGWLELSGRSARIFGLAFVLIGITCVGLQVRMIL